MVIPKTYGRMGNFLFQAACAIGYAHDHQLQFSLPCETNDPKWNPIYLQHLVNPKFDVSLPEVRIKERADQGFSTLPYKRNWIGHNIILDGYWQDQRYFQHIRTEIIRLFGLPWTPLKGTVSVHVRRGDYLTIRRNGMLKHPPVSKEWIETQMRKFNPTAGFMFFSDDIEWCMQNFSQRTDCSFAVNGSEMSDLTTMASCEHQICSASTFSWWGAWLNQNPEKRVIMPKHWLTPGWSNFNTDAIVPREWERA